MADNKSREVIGGKRYCGKTSELIKLASEKNIRILCPNKDMAWMITNEAKRMGVKIKPPLTPDVRFENFLDEKEILVDEVEMVLAAITGKQIVGMSTSLPLKELPSLRGEERTRSYNSKSVGQLHVDVDCSDALKGLKAIQREAREATAALKELEGHKNNNTLIVKCNFMINDEERNKVTKKIQEGLRNGLIIFDDSCDYEFVSNITDVKVSDTND